MPKLIDAHTHVPFPAYGDDSEEVTKRALDKDIWMVNVGTNLKTSKEAVSFAEGYSDGVYATIGLHPNNTYPNHYDKNELGESDKKKHSGEELDYNEYLKLGQSKKVVAIGEFGLDYFRMEGDRKKEQETAFMSQIDLAKELDLPLMIHCRDAFHDLIGLLKERKNDLKSDYPGINHFFTGSVSDATELMELGFSFSFGGVITFTKDYDEVIKHVGLDKIVLETDAPYVAPEPNRGKRNEPAYIVHTAKRLAEIFEKDYKEVASVTTQNARNILGI